MYLLLNVLGFTLWLTAILVSQEYLQSIRVKVRDGGRISLLNTV